MTEHVPGVLCDFEWEPPELALPVRGIRKPDHSGRHTARHPLELGKYLVHPERRAEVGS